MDRALNLPWLLVATPQLTDTNFKRAVVLIVEATEQGSMGFVINRPIQASLADLVNVPNIEIPQNVPAWYGGPVERGTGIILHDRPRPTGPGQEPPTSFISYPGEREGEGLALSSSEQTLIDLVDYSIRRSQSLEAQNAEADGIAERGLYPYRFLVGYSGWGPGQLEDELRQGAWIQAPATHELLFHTPWKNLWDAALSAVGASPKTLVPSVHEYLN